MAVGIKVGSIIDEIGTGDFLHAFFSTLSANLESGWGDRFPALLRKLYSGELASSEAAIALAELATVQNELEKFSVDRVVWDHEDRSKRPPWGDDISTDITDLSHYFVTSTGRDLIETLREALEASRDGGMPASIVAY